MPPPRHSLFQISEVANGLIDPILARRAGINTMLLGAWDDIAGPEFADCTRPEKIAWPGRAHHGADEPFRAGSLLVACEGARALFLTHSQDQLVQRVNAFFGFNAIERIRIVQKPVAPAKGRTRRPVRLAENQQRRLDGMLHDIDDEKLKAALERLGRNVIGAPKRA